MTDRELRRLKRAELLEMLLAQSRETEALKAELAQAKKQLAERTIKIDKAGSIAEAALQVSGIFETAQKAAEQYLLSVEALSGRQEKICAERVTKCKREMQRLKADTVRECEELKLRTEEECQKRVRDAERQAEEEWQKVSQRLEKFLQAHEELRETFDTLGKGMSQK